MHSSVGLGLILGPLLGVLAAGHGVRAPFWVAACIATATLIAGYFLFPETLSGHDIRQNTDEGTRKIMRFSTSFLSSSGSLVIVFFLFEVSSVVAYRCARSLCFIRSGERCVGKESVSR